MLLFMSSASHDQGQPWVCCLQIWVPYDDGQLPEQLTETAFAELASTAAGKAAAKRKQQEPYQPPPW